VLRTSVDVESRSTELNVPGHVWKRQGYETHVVWPVLLTISFTLWSDKVLFGVKAAVATQDSTLSAVFTLKSQLTVDSAVCAKYCCISLAGAKVNVC